MVWAQVRLAEKGVLEPLKKLAEKLLRNLLKPVKWDATKYHSYMTKCATPPAVRCPTACAPESCCTLHAVPASCTRTLYPTSLYRLYLPTVPAKLYLPTVPTPSPPHVPTVPLECTDLFWQHVKKTCYNTKSVSSPAWLRPSFLVLWAL